MGITANESSRFAALLSEHAEHLVTKWTEIAAASMRGRTTEAELRQEVQELHRVLIAALGDGPFDLTTDSAAGLRATLADLSRIRARQGFTATETAISVFALKDALIGILNVRDADRELLADFVAGSTVVDQRASTPSSGTPNPVRNSSPTRPNSSWSCPLRW